MSYLDLATLTTHRRNEMEARINTFVDKCDHAAEDIDKLKTKAQSFLLQLNCDPSELKERFLKCMKQLDEYIYVVTDFNLAIGKLETAGSVEYTPVHDTSTPVLVPQPVLKPCNLIDMLSEPVPSTSTACSVHYPPSEHKQKKLPKGEHLLINFSSASNSTESVPEAKSQTVEKDVQCEVSEDMQKLNLHNQDSLTPASTEQCNLPAQTVLQTNRSYPATIINVDGTTLWIITENPFDLYCLITGMTEYYKKNVVTLSLQEITNLTYCAFYDANEDTYYRGLLIKLVESEHPSVEVFLVDTGEIRGGAASCVQPLASPYWSHPPYARCCHLAGLEFLNYKNKDLIEYTEDFLRNYLGMQCTIDVDDNTSESLGVYVVLGGKELLNEILVNEGVAVPIDRKPESAVEDSAAVAVLPQSATSGASVDVKPTSCAGATSSPGAGATSSPSAGATSASFSGATSSPSKSAMLAPPELCDSDFDIANLPEHEDALEAVTGYHCRDEADICKHYKGPPEKTCFKGSRCKKRHVLKHPDGWTLDRVEVPAVRPAPLPAPDTWHKVLITYVCHFDRFYAHFIAEKDKTSAPPKRPAFGVVLPPETLDDLVRDMNSSAAIVSYKPLTMIPAPGEMVAAMYPLDGHWYRARVLSLSRADQTVEVKYVDYGNTLWVKEDAVRALEARYASLPQQAVLCRLAGVVPSSQQSRQWALARQALQRIIQDKKLDAHVIGREYDELLIEVFDAEGYNVAEQLAAQQLVGLKEYSVQQDTGVRCKLVVP